MIRLLVVLGVCSTLATRTPRAGAQQHALVVNVADAENGQPIRDADVRIVGTSRTGRTDWIGEVRFGNLPATRQLLEVRKLGYAPASLEIPISRDTSGAIFLLEKLAHSLETVEVRGRVVQRRFAEFELHRWMGIGRFLSDSMLAREGTHAIGVVLASHFPGLTLASVESSGRDSVVATSHSGLLFSLSPTCPVAVYVDGIWSPDGLSMVRTEELHGVEYYDITTAPVQYRRQGRACKVLLFWTKP